MGTPNEEHWPEALKLEYFKATFPKWKAVPIGEHAEKMDPTGLDLLAALIALEPKKRISARMALKHVSSLCKLTRLALV